MKINALKYSMALIIPIVLFFCVTQGGWWSLGAVIFAFGLLPALELVLPFSTKNMDKIEEEFAKKDRLYDFMVYLIVPVHYTLVFISLANFRQENLTWYEYVGGVSALGLSCGIFGINVAHELGHRTTKFEQFLSKLLLMSSLYMHFFIEHNRGHHKNVSTDDDPASARYGENLYAFWFRSVKDGYLSAWHLENSRLQKLGKSAFSIKNEMIWYHIIQATFLGTIWFFFGGIAVGCFVGAAIFGFLLLETVNYVEHYGLRRKKNEYGAWEKTLPIHSWNSNHPLGRMMLFELTRHSDHHYMPNRKYQILRHFDESPQLPTGYPGMMIVSFFPPIWFKMMHKKIDNLKQENTQLA